MGVRYGVNGVRSFSPRHIKYQFSSNVQQLCLEVSPDNGCDTRQTCPMSRSLLIDVTLDRLSLSKFSLFFALPWKMFIWDFFSMPGDGGGSFERFFSGLIWQGIGKMEWKTQFCVFTERKNIVLKCGNCWQNWWKIRKIWTLSWISFDKIVFVFLKKASFFTENEGWTNRK